MFAPGELIYCGRRGVCRVENIEEIDGRPYYHLEPLYYSCTIHTPVDGKVFMRYKNYAQETLLFNFTLEAGDAFMMAYQVEDVDTICTTGGLYMRRLRLNYDVWVEGIGGPGGPVRNNSFQVNGDPTIKLLSVYDSDNCIFTADDFSAPAVHGTTDNMSFPQASPQPVTAPFFDLQGRRLDNAPTRSGLYIKDGWKVVVR